ncbi:MAG: tetratricopeptide repeat protein [bacterium]
MNGFPPSPWKGKSCVPAFFFIFFGLTAFIFAQSVEDLNKMQFARGLFEDGMYEMSRREFLKISAYQGGGQVASEMQSEADFMQAECLFRMKNYPLAYSEFQRVYLENPLQEVKKSALKRMADASFQMSQWDAAEALYKEHIRKYGVSEEVLFYLSECLFSRKEYDAASLHYLRLLEKFPESSYKDYAFYSLGYSGIHQGKFAKAAEYFSSVSNADLVKESRFYEGVAMLKSGKLDAAAEKFQEVKKAYPLTEWAVKADLKAAEIFIIQKKFDRAEQILRPLIGKENFSAHANYLMGQVFYNRDRFAEAALYYGEVYDKFPSSEWAEKSLFSLGWCYLNLKDYGTARKKFAELILKYSKTPYFAKAQFLIGHCYFFEENFSEAEKAYGLLTEAFPLSDEVTEAMYWRAVSLMKIEEWERASGMFEKIVRKAGDFEFLGKAFLNRGLCLEKENRTEDAIKVFKEGLGRNFPAVDKDALFYALGNVCVKAGRYQDAVASYKKVETQEMRIKSLLAIAHTWVNARKFDEARRQYSEVISQFPQTDEAEEAAFSMGLSFYKEKKWANAVSNFMDFIAKYPESSRVPRAYYFAGWSAFTARDFQNAVDLWDNYFKIHPDDEILLHIGDSYYNAGDFDAAVSSYEKLIRDFPASNKIANALNSIALVNRKRGDLETAAENLRKLKAGFPASPLLPSARFLLGEIYAEQKFYEKAYEEYLGIFSAFPKEKIAEDALYRAAVSARELKDYSRAEKTFKKLIEAYPAGIYLIEARFRICEIYFNVGDYENAVSGALSFRRDFPESQFSPLSLQIAADALKELHRDDRASEILKQIETVYPKSSPASKIYFSRGKSLFEEKKYEKAIEELRKVTGHDRSSALAQGMIAESFFKSGSLEQARIEALRVVYIYPEFDDLVSENQYLVGLIYLRQGRKKEAREVFEKVKDGSEWAEKAKEQIEKLR